ncbi:recombinase family protein [Ruminococcus albus]|uniref:Site-specific DNA recombinase n=1 Tax=Ruminococcus albus TaxID=1264 RepID=A0A1H7MKA3_RUMAL|nr:recombinase family protein [Ruminococcus albus]SEL11740.1 site-specific DNA recombinase [Ruminococcus albus]
MKNRRTALYIRVSTDAQFEEGYSVDAQKEKLAQYCKLKDIENYEFYIDGGWSGSNIDRPEIKRLITDIKSGKIDAVVVYKLDRLSRSQKDTVFLLEDVFIPNGCAFISLNENFDTSTPYGKAMIGILSVFAQLERENIRERTRMGMYERVKSGLWMGGGRVPFGYDYDREKNTLVPNEKAEQVRQIFQLYLQGYSTTQLAGMFDVSGNQHISAILDRETYLGRIRFRGEVVESCHEAIIDEETWRRVREERRRRSRGQAGNTSYLLTGLLVCGKCGAKMRYQKWGRGLKIYCYSQQKSKPTLIKDPDCVNMRYDADEVENAVIADVFEKTRSITANGGGRREISAEEVLKRKYDTAAGKLKRLYELYARDGEEVLFETINEYKAQLADISAAIENEKQTKAVEEELAYKRGVLENLAGLWDEMTVAEKRRALRTCIDRIVLNDEDIDIVYLV